jgi:pilus assembly protein CpaF
MARLQPEPVSLADPHARFGKPDGGPRAGGDAPPLTVVREDGPSGLHKRLHQKLLLAMPAGQAERASELELRRELNRLVGEMSRDHPELLRFAERESAVEQVLDEVLGYGPLGALMRDHEISEILINGPRQLFIEKYGQLQPTDVTFRDEEQLLQVVRRLLVRSGRRIDDQSPMVDARLPDGSRLNAVMKPPALNGPLVSIRRFGARPLTAEDLLTNESLAREMLDFLAACVKAKVNVLIAGGAGSGKTTLLNALSRYIPNAERVVTIEDTAELELQQPHVAKMEAQPPDLRGQGAVTIRDLVKNALRMRPDRIIVGECRGAEALEMLQAMNTGHEGSLTTVHANSPRETFSRLELMISLAGIDVPGRAVRKLIANSINLVVQVARLQGGKRKVVAISEVTGMEGDTISMHDLFEFVQTGVDPDGGAVEGYFRAVGIRPACLKKLLIRGANLPLDLFLERRLVPQRNQESAR